METARRFVSAFYQQLAEGQRIGSAVLAGRQALMQSTDRINIAGAGTLQMQDWFVPVLYQREDDPRLFSHALQLPDETEPEWLLGDLPETPKHTFIGRSRDLLKLERLLDRQPYAVIRGMGGIGKTAVAVELARWLVQCRRFERCAFVSVETYTHERAIVDILGKQLVNEKYSVAEYGDNLDAALQPIMQVLQTQRTLLVIDNMEALLADVGNTEHVLALADRLIKSAPQNRLLFTSYEALPIPFEQQQCTINLGALSSDDAKQLVTKVMSIKSQLLSFNVQSNALEEVRVLANTVNCHARTLVSLANEIKTTEVTNASQNIRGTILKLERIYSIRKNKSFFSNVRKSIEQINHVDIKFIKSLAVFHSHASIKILQKILGVDDKKIRKIINEMTRAGLAEEIIEHDYLRFDPMLSIYMDFSITSKQKELYQNRLINSMDEKIKYLCDLYQNNSLKYEDLIKMEMPNFLINREIPRLCRGDVHSLTFPEVHPETSTREPPSTCKGESGWTSLKA